MHKLAKWFAGVPVGVWLFLAATQALNLAVAPSRISDATEGLEKVAEMEKEGSGHPYLTDHRDLFESIRREQKIHAIVAAILLPCFAAAALWKMKKPREAKQQSLLN